MARVRLKENVITASVLPPAWNHQFTVIARETGIPSSFLQRIDDALEMGTKPGRIHRRLTIDCLNGKITGPVPKLEQIQNRSRTHANRVRLYFRLVLCLLFYWRRNPADASMDILRGMRADHDSDWARAL